METKVCSVCKEEKALADYHKKKDCRLGVNSYCIACHKEKSRKHYKKNASRIRTAQRERFASLPEEEKDAKRRQVREWHKNNPEKRFKHEKKYRNSVRGKAVLASQCRSRQAAQLQRTPPWSDMSAIAEFYVEAKRLEELTGIQFHVDHIVPLQGELVSGLHVPANLQLLPAHENLSKGNSFAVAA